MSKYQTPTQTQIDSMNACVNTLIGAQLLLSSQVAVQGSGWNAIGNWVTGSDDVQTQVAGATVQWAKQIDKLAATDEPEVIAGNQSLEGWFGTAKALYDSMKSTGTDIGNWTWDGIVSQTYTATATEVKKDVAVGAAIATPILLLVGGLYLLLIFGGRR